MSPLTAFLDANARTLLTLVPALRDGRVDAVHDARVATRRLRAALGILASSGDYPHLAEAAQLARRTARVLGRVRDLDVALALLDDLERRAPAAAQAAAYCRQELVRERTAARRRLVKKLDQIAVSRLPTLLSAGVPRLRRSLDALARDRAEGVAAAVHHASGVYFPRRAHAARIEIKKLRYVLEFHDGPDTGAPKVLRKAQEILGDIQDREVVRAMVERLQEAPSPQVDLAPLLSMLEAECVVLYDRFIERRAEVLAVCERIIPSRAASRPRLVAGTLLTASAVVAGSVFHLRRSR